MTSPPSAPPPIPPDEERELFSYFQSLQNTLATALAAENGAPPAAKAWQSRLGRGAMQTFHHGPLIERGGVNYSRIAGDRLPPAAGTRHPQLTGRPYRAGGVSAVIHPKNPYCPTAHLNVRWFTAADVWWFGGGMDLTPYYGFPEDCRHFHGTVKRALDARDPTLYPRFKQQCDDYFFISHRNEARGIGGVFFDDHRADEFAAALAVMQAVGDSFLPAYLPLLQKRRHTPYGPRQRDWQKHRRGRYVEFNLVYDRGTLFGLQSNGNSDAILMSLPPAACWGDPTHPPGTEERRLLDEFLPPRDWAAAAAAVPPA